MKEKKLQIRGELALIPIILLNSLGVVMMLYSGSGISAISSVPYAIHLVLPRLSLGTWTYIFQALLVCSLFILRKKFHIPYLFSFVVGFFFGLAVDFHESWISLLPKGFGFQIVYFCISYLLICFGISISNRCGMPIVPTDLFPREVSQILKIKYSTVKVTFDVSCLAATFLLTFLFLGHIEGLGVGTILAAFTLGKAIGLMGKWMDRHIEFIPPKHHTAPRRPVAQDC